jgi:restriction endonuclease S subunit
MARRLPARTRASEVPGSSSQPAQASAAIHHHASSKEAVGEGGTAKVSVLSNWKTVRLGEVLEQVHRPEPVEPDREYRLLGVRWYANGCHLHTVAMGRSLKTKVLAAVQSGDITYNKMWTSKGAFGMVTPEQNGLVATSEYPVFIARNGSLSGGFLQSVFRQPKFWMAARAFCKGTTERARLHPRDFLRLEIPLPSVQEQERIAAILCSLDQAIQANEEVLASTSALKKALAHELLTRGLPGRHSRFKESPAGTIPEGWTVSTLDRFAAVHTGLAKNKTRHAAGPIEVPYLSVGNVQDGYVDTAILKRVRVAAADLARYGLSAGDVLLTEGGDNDKLGRGCVWDGHIYPCLHQNHVFAVRCGDGLLPPFLSLYTSSPQGRRYFLNASKQTTNLASINMGQLRAMPVPLPDINEQRSICEIVSAVTASLQTSQDQVTALRELRELLTRTLLRGHIPHG